MRASSSFTTASFARPYWNAATRYGTAHATTTFHEQYNKRDCVYSYGRCGDFVRQDGLRGLALGYLTKVRFARFLTTPLATELTGLDLTKPGQSAAQSARVVEVTEEFFDLLLRYSHSHPYCDGDYGNVMRSRALPRNSFCIFTGFAEALASRELATLRSAWWERYEQAPSPPSSQSSPLLPSAPPPPAPPPAQTPPPVQERAPTRVPRRSPVRRLGALLPVLVMEWERASRSRTCAFRAGPSGRVAHASTELYAVQVIIARRGARRGHRRAIVVAKGALKRALRVTVMRSADEIRAAFRHLRRSDN